MKTFARSVALTVSLLGVLALAPDSAAAAGHGSGSWSGGHSGGSWNGGWHAHPGNWHGGYWGHGGYYYPYWGAVAVGVGIGYWGGYWGGYYPPYPYYAYGYGYYDATVDHHLFDCRTGRRHALGPAGAAGRARTRADLLSEERTKRGDDRVRPSRVQSLGHDPGRRDERREHLPARDLRLHGRPRLHRPLAALACDRLSAGRRRPAGGRRGAVIDCAARRALPARFAQDVTSGAENRW